MSARLRRFATARAVAAGCVAITALAAITVVACDDASPAPALETNDGEDAASADATVSAVDTSDGAGTPARAPDASDAGIGDANANANAITDASQDCSTAHQALDQLFDGSTCGACVESKCSDFYSSCTQSCNCTTGLDIFFQCLELGGSGSQCQSETFSYLTPAEYGPVYQCKVDCLYECSVLEAGPDE